MHGHGSDSCHIKPLYLNCTGHHKTRESTVNKIKCASCGEAHKSTDPSCRSKIILIQGAEMDSTEAILVCLTSHMYKSQITIDSVMLIC